MAAPPRPDISGPYRTTAGSDDVALGVPGGRLQRRRDGRGEDELIEKVNAHVAEAHASYELEDVILANAEEVDDGRD